MKVDKTPRRKKRGSYGNKNADRMDRKRQRMQEKKSSGSFVNPIPILILVPLGLALLLASALDYRFVLSFEVDFWLSYLVKFFLFFFGLLIISRGIAGLVKIDPPSILILSLLIYNTIFFASKFIRESNTYHGMEYKFAQCSDYDVFFGHEVGQGLVKNILDSFKPENQYLLSLKNQECLSKKFTKYTQKPQKLCGEQNVTTCLERAHTHLTTVTKIGTFAQMNISFSLLTSFSQILNRSIRDASQTDTQLIAGTEKAVALSLISDNVLKNYYKFTYIMNSYPDFPRYDNQQIQDYPIATKVSKDNIYQVVRSEAKKCKTGCRYNNYLMISKVDYLLYESFKEDFKFKMYVTLKNIDDILLEFARHNKMSDKLREHRSTIADYVQIYRPN